MDETKKAVDNYLSAIQARFSAVYVRKNSTAHSTLPGSFRWSVAFQRVGRGASEPVDFDFYMGSAHVGRNKQPKAPSACEVLYCLISDAQAIGQCFEGWAYERGFDPDSRRAERTYQACREEAQKLARVFTADERKALADMMEGY